MTSEAEKLVKARKKYLSRDPKMAVRINLIHLVRVQGYDMADAARFLMHSYNWAKETVERYDRDGLDGLTTRPIPGRSKKVSDEKFSRIIDRMYKKHPALDVRQVRDEIKKVTGISYHATNVAKRMRKLNLIPKKPKKLHVNRAGPDECARWSRNMSKTVPRMAKKGHVTMVHDECVFMYDDKIGRLWVKKGTDYYVPYTGAHKKIVVSGMLLKDGRQMYRSFEKFDAESFVSILKSAVYKFGKIHVIADRAAQHVKSKLVKKFLKKHKDRIKISFFPKSSSFLNATEETWRQGKATVHRPYVYSSFEEMAQAVMEFYRTHRFNLDIMKYIKRAAVECSYL